MGLLAGQSAVRGVVSMSFDDYRSCDYNISTIVKPCAKSREVLQGKEESEKGSNVADSCKLKSI